jgi:hypothetical protein
LRRAAEILAERGFVEIDRRRIEHVEPQHRLVRRVAVVVRGPIGGDDEIARRHERLLALDRRVGALAIEHEADRGGDMAMRRRDLARHDHLDAGKQRIGDPRLPAQRRVFQDQHAALGLFGGDQAARFHDQGFDVVEMPDRRRAARYRLVAKQRAHDCPQRGHGMPGNACVEVPPHRLDIVLAVGLGLRLFRFHGRHDVLHIKPNERMRKTRSDQPRSFFDVAVSMTDRNDPVYALGEADGISSILVKQRMDSLAHCRPVDGADNDGMRSMGVSFLDGTEQ